MPASPFNASTLVKLDFESPNACWFDLRPNTGACGDNSLHFTILPTVGSQATVGLPQPSPTVEKIATATATPPKNITVLAIDNTQGSKRLGTAAQIGIGIGVSIVVGLLVGGLAVFFWLRRRSGSPEDRLLLGRSQDAESSSRPNSKGPAPHDPVQHQGSRTPSSAPQENQLDDAYYVGYLPGFYGSARESGSNHNVSAPSTGPYGPVARPSRRDAGHSSTNLHSQRSDSIAGDIVRGNEAAFARGFGSSDAELPGPESHRGYGEEFELPARPQQQPFGIPRREAQEQKFLLHDMELFGLKSKGPGPSRSS